MKLLEQVYYFKPFKEKEGFLSTIQYYMHDLIYQKDQVILDFDEECSKLYFVVNGCVDLEIMSNDGTIKVLDTLEQGDTICQFSVLFHTKIVFRIVAKATSVRILTLSDEFFVEYGDKQTIDGLGKAI